MPALVAKVLSSRGRLDSSEESSSSRICRGEYHGWLHRRVSISGIRTTKRDADIFLYCLDED